MRIVALIVAVVLACQPLPARPPDGGAGGTGGHPAAGGTPATDAALGGRPACNARITRAKDRAAPRNTRPRIVGGVPVDIGLWPWVAALETTTGFQFCGGTLVRPGWVATAAHCEVSPGERVVLGRADLRTGMGETIAVVEVRTHPAYTSADLGFDVAVLGLERPATAEPVALVPSGWQGPSVLAEILGWGLTVEGASATSPILRGAEVPIWPSAACTASAFDVPWTVLCAARDAGGVDTCQGDSGGPLLVNLGGADGVWWALAGITSFGEGCARPGKPGYYTDVGWARAWIDECTQ